MNISTIFPEAAAKLVKLIAMLGSGYDGEVVAAARAAARLMREHGLDWHDVAAAALRPAPATSAGSGWAAGRDGDDRADITFALARWRILTPWERDFSRSLHSWRGRLTDRQRATLNGIVRRLREAERAACAA